MSYQLRDGLSFCHVDGRPVFLDVPNDRYFMLSASLERAFSAYASNIDTDSLAPLIERNLLVTARSRSDTQMPAVALPIRSVLEQQVTAKRASARDYLEVLATVVRIKLMLKTKPLGSVLRDVCAYRDARAPSACAPHVATISQDIVAFTHRFLTARSWIPVGRTCLLDSLSLLAFLTNRGLTANIVFGVSLSPFSAHCWVQCKDVVLNETVTGANSHTRILTR